jgi:hypothetical protein
VTEQEKITPLELPDLAQKTLDAFRLDLAAMESGFDYEYYCWNYDQGFAADHDMRVKTYRTVIEALEAWIKLMGYEVVKEGA